MFTWGNLRGALGHKYIVKTRFLYTVHWMVNRYKLANSQRGH